MSENAFSKCRRPDDGSNLAEIVDEFKKKYFQYAMGRFELVAADTDTTLRNYGVPLKFVNSREFLYRAVSNSDEPEEFVLNAEFDPKVSVCLRVCLCWSVTQSLVFTHSMVQGVKPPPQNPTQRVWWLLGQLLTSMNKGVYLTPALYVPAAAWKSKPALPAVRDFSTYMFTRSPNTSAPTNKHHAPHH